MKRPESDFTEAYTEFEDLFPDKKKMDAALPASERQTILSDKLYQIYTADPVEGEADDSERKLVARLMSEQIQFDVSQAEFRRAARNDMLAALNTYWPIIIPAGLSAATTYLFLGYKLVEEPLPTNFLMQDGLWEYILKSDEKDPLFELVTDNFGKENSQYAMFALMVLLVTAIVIFIYGAYWLDREEGIGTIREGINFRKSLQEENKKKILDLIHLLGINEGLLLDDERVLGAVQSASKRAVARQEVMAHREETMKRRREQLARAGISTETEIGGRVDDFPTTLEDEVARKLKMRRR